MCYNKLYINQILDNSKKQATLFYTFNSILTLGFLFNVFSEPIKAYCIGSSVVLSITLVLSIFMALRNKVNIQYLLKKVMCMSMTMCIFASFVIGLSCQLVSITSLSLPSLLISFGWHIYAILYLYISYKRYRDLNKEWIYCKNN